MYVANTSQWTEKHMIEQHNEDRGMLLGERNNNNNNIDDNIWRSTRDLVYIPAPLDDCTALQLYAKVKQSAGLKHIEGKNVKFSHTRYRALDPELIPVYRQSARR